MTTMTEQEVEAALEAAKKAFYEGDPTDKRGQIRAALLAAAAARPAQDGWQPIETAPKDGTPVLLWIEFFCASGGPMEGVRPMMATCWNHGDGWYGGPSQVPGFSPTHWRPLPAPPQQSEDDEGSPL